MARLPGSNICLLSRMRQRASAVAFAAPEAHLGSWPCSQCCPRCARRSHPQPLPHPQTWVGTRTASARRPPARAECGGENGEVGACICQNQLHLQNRCHRCGRPHKQTARAAQPRLHHAVLTSPTPTPSAAAAAAASSPRRSTGRSWNRHSISAQPLWPASADCCRCAVAASSSSRSRPAAFHLQMAQMGSEN